MTVDVAVVGAACVDLVVEVPRLPASDETVFASPLAVRPSGKGLNQAGVPLIDRCETLVVRYEAIIHFMPLRTDFTQLMNTPRTLNLSAANPVMMRVTVCVAAGRRGPPGVGGRAD